MKIVIKDSDMKHGIHLLLPNSMMKWKWIYSIIIKNVDPKTQDKIIKIKNNARQIYKIIKKYFKANGHFVLVEAIDSDGSIVRIKV